MARNLKALIAGAASGYLNTVNDPRFQRRKEDEKWEEAQAELAKEYGIGTGDLVEQAPPSQAPPDAGTANRTPPMIPGGGAPATGNRGGGVIGRTIAASATRAPEQAPTALPAPGQPGAGPPPGGGQPPDNVTSIVPDQTGTTGGLINRARTMNVPDTTPPAGSVAAAPTAASAGSTAVNAPRQQPDWSGYYDALARKAVEMGRADDVLTMLKMNETMRSQLYRDSLRKARPLMQAWVMAGDHKALEQAMNEGFPDGHEYVVKANDDGTYQVKVDGKESSQAMTADQLTMQAASALQSEENYVESLTSSIQSRQERRQKLEDQIAKERRSEQRDIRSERREERRDITAEKRQSIIERQTAKYKAELKGEDSYRPPTPEERSQYNIPRGAMVQVDQEGKLHVAGGKSTLTGAQAANNSEIDAARQALKGLSREEILRRSRKQTDTGRENPDFDPYIEGLLKQATQRKVGQDDEFEAVYGEFYGTGDQSGAKPPQEMTDDELLQQLGISR